MIEEKGYEETGYPDRYYQEFFGDEGTDGISDYYDYIIFGLSYDEMKLDETLDQFRQRVFNALKYPGIKLENIVWYKDGGYNG